MPSFKVLEGKNPFHRNRILDVYKRQGQNRSGMGFTVMESFTDKLKVDSKPGEGTTVTMIKKMDTYYGF